MTDNLQFILTKLTVAIQMEEMVPLDGWNEYKNPTLTKSCTGF